MIIRYEATNGVPTLKIDTEEPQDGHGCVAFLSATTHAQGLSHVQKRNVFIGMTMEELKSMRAVIDSIITINK